MDWRGLLYPRLSFSALLLSGFVALTGAVLGGLYGVLHDQITYSISEEYFTRNKFDQFSYAKPPMDSPRVFAGIIGFLATWWVGALVAWVLARISLAREGEMASPGRLARSFAIVFAVSIAAALSGFLYSLWRKSTGYATAWHDWMDDLGVVDREAFMSVGYIHNASYLGGCLGMMVGIAYLCRTAPGKLSRPDPVESEG